MIKEAAILKNGVIYTGRRHNEIIHKYYPIVGQFKADHPQGDPQGFVTDDGKFVTRQEAGKIAFECGQTKEYHQTLYSEDLY